MPGSVADDSQMNEWAEVTRHDLGQAVLGRSVQPHMLAHQLQGTGSGSLAPPSSIFLWREVRQGAQAQRPPQQHSMGFPTASLPRCGRPAPHVQQRWGGCGLCPCRSQLRLLEQNRS